VLADVGLVSREQRGRWAFFRLRPEKLAIVLDALSVEPLAATAGA
jgi:DNA-binding transcriptional ArsR family regulator